MTTVLAIAQNDLACYAKNRMAIFWTFLGPAVCMWFFGFLTPSANGLTPISFLTGNSHSAFASRLIDALRRNGHVVKETDRRPTSGTSIEVERDTARVILHESENDVRADRSLKYEIKAAMKPNTSAAISLEIPVGAQPVSTSGFQRTVPAYLIMFLTMNLLISGAGFAEERASGRMRRLLTAPVTRLSVIAGRLLSRLVIAWLQMLVLFSIGVFVLRVHWAEHSASLILMLSLYVLAMGSIGILIGTCFQDPSQASAFAMWSALILAPLTGLWWPVELMPRALQTVAQWLPTGWVMLGVNTMLASNVGIADFRFTFVGLLAVAAIAIGLSARRLGALAMPKTA